MKTVFKLKTRSTAILAENDKRSAIPIPARATVVLVGGNLDEDAFVKIRYENKVLFMLSEDLRNGGERWEERHNGSLSRPRTRKTSNSVVFPSPGAPVINIRDIRRRLLRCL